MKTKQLLEGWKEVELGDREYFTILASGINKFEGEKEYLSTLSIQGTKINKIEEIITNKNRPSRANMQPILNSVWFAKMQNTLKVYSFGEKNKEEIDKYILSTGFAGIKVNEKLVSIDYLRLLLTSEDFNKLKDKLCTGSTQKGINNTFIKRIGLVIPPLETQKKIITFIEKAEKSKEWRKEADELINSFLKSIFFEIFGDPVRNEKKWETEEVKEVAEVRGRVGWKGYKKTDLVKSGPLVLGATHITKSGFIDISKPVYLSREKYEESPEIKIEKYDLIFSQRGSLGLTGLIASDIGEATINPCALIIRPKKINPFYFNALLNFYSTRNKIIQLGRTTSIPMITQKDIKEFKIAVPPIELQNKFASIVKEVEAMKEQQKHSKNQIDNLFNALMQKAFKGELKC